MVLAFWKGNNSVISCDSKMVPAFCTSSDGLLSMYQVSFTSCYTFRNYAPDKLFIAKNNKESINSVDTGDRVSILAFCSSPHGPLSVYQVSLNYLQYF